jgi:hypothetical protein
MRGGAAGAAWLAGDASLLAVVVIVLSVGLADIVFE